MAYRGNKVRITRMAESRIAWAKTVLCHFQVRFHPPETNGDKVDQDGIPLRDTQIGPNVQLEIEPTWRGARPIRISLTGLTEAELIAARKVIELAFDLALPVARDRDAHAKTEDPSTSVNTRYYRSLPEFAIRTGAFEPYSEGLWFRSQDASGGAGGGDSSDRGTGGDRSVVADHASEEAGSADDSSSTD